MGRKGETANSEKGILFESPFLFVTRFKMRILILIAIGLLLYVIIGNLWRRSRSQPSPPKAATEKMVKCKQCGLHILEQEAIRQADNYYCSHEHLEADS